jgi:polyketide biosynthesis enoyl-CoA hydratase PksI
MMTHLVVHLATLKPGVALIRMEDRAHNNTFSEGLIQGLMDAFKEVNNNSNYKAVILTGYDSYFASGGTKEGLIALHERKGTFADINIYSLPLECPIPVISAMQGHGIGGGFVLGLFADFVVLARESIYTTNFMNYGFTPGMGATLVVPEKLGSALGEEMLLMADTYRGEALQYRGIPFPVVPREEVLERAYEMASLLAEKPRHSLITLKKHLTRTLRAKLPEIITQELRLHEETFHQNEVRQMIEDRFVSYENTPGKEDSGHG